MVTSGLENLCRALNGEVVNAPGSLPELVHRIKAGARCGLVFNMSSVTSNLQDACSELLKAGANLKALFGPEHGALGAAGAGSAVASSRDPATGLPIFSLYGATTRPAPAMLEPLDLVIFDLQDVGARYYTYTWTLAAMMESCAAAGLPMAILDRPNPLGGVEVEGPIIEPGLASFVGRWPIPVVHGMTPGELAQLFAARFVPGSHLLVAGLEGWRRAMTWPDTGLPWAAPSPNIPTAETALIYPATCLLEGTNVSEGRGTAAPFKVFGAPWADPRRLADCLAARTSSQFRPVCFIPSTSKFSGKVCRGVEWYPPTAGIVRPVRLGLEIIAAFRELWPQKFEWLIGGTGRSHFDLLIGQSDIRRLIDDGTPAHQIYKSWSAVETAFRETRAEFLLYD